MTQTPIIAIIGLGYVGAPLLAAFAEHHECLGFDISPRRIEELETGHDSTGELDQAERERVAKLTLTTNPAELAKANTWIVTVPTPVTDDHQPDLQPLINACEAIGPHLKQGDTVVFESTVYPGATEEVCLPILEAHSGLQRKTDFWFGYSPERINPGDRERRLQHIVKVVSGCCKHSLDYIEALYSQIVSAGTHRASSVQVAEAAKVIENTQRDVNIALINELAMLFDRLGLDTREVLEAAGTKWNFLPFEPGLVGGHCIGVDPYYLTHKALEVNFNPNIILAGRSVNDGMADWVAEKVCQLMQDANILVTGARVLVLGLTFKENCPDTRNSQVFKLVCNLQARDCSVDVWDPWVLGEGEAPVEEGAGPNGPLKERLGGGRLVARPNAGVYQAVVTTVPHRQFRDVSAETYRKWAAPSCIFYDVKNILDHSVADGRL